MALVDQQIFRTFQVLILAPPPNKKAQITGLLVWIGWGTRITRPLPGPRPTGSLRS
jgi:hypothetical protein